MSQNPPPEQKLKTGSSLLQTKCGLCQLLERFGAVYSVKTHKLEFVTGTLSPVCCNSCGSRFLVEESDQGGCN